MKPDWTQRCAITEAFEDGMVLAYCIPVFLLQAQYRVVVHRQHVGARIMALIYWVNENPSAQGNKGDSLPTSLEFTRSAARGRGSSTCLRSPSFMGKNDASPR
jgi:hypothetical protein